MRAKATNVESFLSGINAAIDDIGRIAKSHIASTVPENYRSLVLDADLSRNEAVDALNALVADDVGSENLVKQVQALVAKDCPVEFSNSEVPAYSANGVGLRQDSSVSQSVDNEHEHNSSRGPGR